MPLAINLDRQSEAVRYALILAEREPTDAALLRRLALYLSEEGDSARALNLCEKALSIEGKQDRSASLVLLRMELGRLYFVAKQFDQAAHQFGEVSKAIDEPAQYGLDPTMLKTLLNKSDLTYQLFGESFLEAGRTAEALTAFEKSHQAKPDEALHVYNLARVDVKQRQPAQCWPSCKRISTSTSPARGPDPIICFPTR